MDYIVYAFEITCNKLITYQHYVEIHFNIGRCLSTNSICRRKRENDYEDSIEMRTLKIKRFKFKIIKTNLCRNCRLIAKYVL